MWILWTFNFRFKTDVVQRILQRQKRLELEMVMVASKEALEPLARQPRLPPVAEMAWEEEQARRRLTHVPYAVSYAAWCPSCIASRARPNRQPVVLRMPVQHLQSVSTFFTARQTVKRPRKMIQVQSFHWSWSAVRLVMLVVCPFNTRIRRT